MSELAQICFELLWMAINRDVLIAQSLHNEVGYINTYMANLTSPKNVYSNSAR
jgi:hypothetical protein